MNYDDYFYYLIMITSYYIMIFCQIYNYDLHTIVFYVTYYIFLSLFFVDLITIFGIVIGIYGR